MPDNPCRPQVRLHNFLLEKDIWLCTAMAAFQETPFATFSPEAILAKIQKYHHNKVKEKIRQRNEKGWMKINKEIKDHWENKQNKEFVPCYIEANEEEKVRIIQLHHKLATSEKPLEGWNWIKERPVRKLHESLFKNDKEYRLSAKRAILCGRPFCPLKRGVVHWITTENEKNEHLQGLCFYCFLRGVYHKTLSVKGTELWEKDEFTKGSRVFINKKRKDIFYKDNGKTGKEQKKRMEIAQLTWKKK